MDGDKRYFYLPPQHSTELRAADFPPGFESVCEALTGAWNDGFELFGVRPEHLVWSEDGEEIEGPAIVDRGPPPGNNVH